MKLGGGERGQLCSTHVRVLKHWRITLVSRHSLQAWLVNCTRRSPSFVSKNRASRHVVWRDSLVSLSLSLSPLMEKKFAVVPTDRNRVEGQHDTTLDNDESYIFNTEHEMSVSSEKMHPQEEPLDLLALLKAIRTAIKDSRDV